VHIVITGASSGIGRDLARAFDAPGNSLSLVARRGSLLEELQRELRAPSEAIVADLADPADPIGWLLRAEARFGPVDVLVNNAGISYVEPVQGVEEARIKALFQVNVNAPIAAIHHVLPGMLARGAGAIVNVASVAGFAPAPYFCHYNATKAALGSFSESLRMELRRTGVHVVSVYPGPIETPMAERNYQQFQDSARARLAPGGDTRTLARLVYRAVEDRAPRVIYPRFYYLAWWLPGIARFVAERLVPEVTGGPTPPLQGDLVNRP
jgi:short-subunit dehydrogenase